MRTATIKRQATFTKLFMSHDTRGAAEREASRFRGRFGEKKSGKMLEHMREDEQVGIGER